MHHLISLIDDGLAETVTSLLSQLRPSGGTTPETAPAPSYLAGDPSNVVTQTAPLTMA